jgi:hypothetical protein
LFNLFFALRGNGFSVVVEISRSIVGPNVLKSWNFASLKRLFSGYVYMSFTCFGGGAGDFKATFFEPPSIVIHVSVTVFIFLITVTIPADINKRVVTY